MGIKRLLIDSQIQDVWTVWYGHTKTGPNRCRDKEEGAARSGTPACSSVQWFNDCAAVSTLVERVGWSLQ